MFVLGRQATRHFTEGGRAQHVGQVALLGQAASAYRVTATFSGL